MYRVLFVDDDEAIGFLVARYRIWKTAGFELADFAYNGREALEKLSAGDFDLIITDIRMPVMNGLDLLRRIREKGYPAIVILASTYQDFTYAKEGIRLGAVEYLEKPYSEEKVAEALRLAEDYLGQEREDAPERYWHALLEGEDPAQLADSLFQEAQERYPQDGERMRRDVAGLLEKVYQKMCEQAPWLKVIDKKDFIIGGRPADEAEEIFKELQWKIKQYGLRSPDLMAVRIARLIEEYLVSDHLQDILAEKLELSKDYIAKLFRGRSGMTISEYTTLLKMEKAKELLRTTNDKVYEIGEALGYSTTDYFTSNIHKQNRPGFRFQKISPVPWFLPVPNLHQPQFGILIHIAVTDIFPHGLPVCPVNILHAFPELFHRLFIPVFLFLVFLRFLFPFYLILVQPGGIFVLLFRQLPTERYRHLFLAFFYLIQKLLKIEHIILHRCQAHLSSIIPFQITGKLFPVRRRINTACLLQ